MEPTIRKDASTYLWIQKDSWRYDFALHRNNREIGSLKATSWTNQEYEVSTDEGAWVFKQEGFWKRVIVCEDASSRARMVTFVPNWGISRGKIEFADGRTYEYSTTGILHAVSRIVDYKGRNVLEIEEGNNPDTKGLRNFMKFGGSIIASEELADRRTLLLLSMFALYLLLCRRNEAGATAAIATMG
jgi:hypothetical protein